MSRIERIGPLEQLPAIPGEDKNLDGMPQCLHAAGEATRAACQVIFLGFGYHQLDIKRLKLPISAVYDGTGPEFFGTAVDCKRDDINRIRRLFSPYQNPEITDIMLGKPQERSLEFLQNRDLLL